MVEVGEESPVEVDLARVMTWPSEAALRERLTSGLPMTSRTVQLAERDAPVDGGMRLPVGSREAWLVRLDMDRPVGPLVAGTRLLQLASEFCGHGGAMVWRLEPVPVWRPVVRSTPLGLALMGDQT